MKEHVGRSRRPWADPVLLTMVVLTAVALPWFWFVGHRGAIISSWAFQVVLDALNATFALRLSRLNAGRRPVQRFWRSVVVAGISCGIGDGYQTLRIVLHPAASDSSVVQTTFVVLGMSTVMITMLAHPLGNGAGRHRLRLWLDAATVLTGAAVFLWYFSLAVVFTTGERGQRWTGAATCAVMLLIVFAVLKLMLGGSAPFGRGPAMLGSLGVAGTALASSLLTTLTGVTDARIIFFASLVPCAVTTSALRLQQLRIIEGRDAEDTDTDRRRSSRLPYAAVVCTQVLVVVAVAGLGAGLRDWGVAVGAVLITALVVSRQLIALHDNERLLAERDRSMRELQEQRERFRSLVQHSSDLTLIVGKDGQVRYASPASERVLGLPTDQLTGISLGEFAHPHDTAILHELFLKLEAGPGADAGVQLRMRHADGSYRWVDVIGADHTGNRGIDGIVLNAHDITEARALHDKLQRQATHDGLTGLGNRMLLEQKLQHTAADDRLAVLLIDLDGFKPVNDQHGHHAGDEVLIAVAQRLTTLTAQAAPNGYAIRLGGDEFAVLLPGAGLAAAQSLAEQVAETIAQPIRLTGETVRIGASVGTAAGRADEASHLLTDADTAMYRHKATRKTPLTVR